MLLLLHHKEVYIHEGTRTTFIKNKITKTSNLTY